MPSFTKQCSVILFTGLSVLSAGLGCSADSASRKTEALHTVNIGPEIQPVQISAGKEEKIRWINTTSNPITVMFPKTDTDRISCRMGFSSIDQATLSALVPPYSSASLCFSEPGKYDYQVRLQANASSAQTDRNATVWIVGRGERNPGPGEQYENIVP